MNLFNSYIIEELIKYREIDPITKCWIHTGVCNGVESFKYGYVQYENKSYPTHRLSAYLSLGFNLDSRLLILHDCDNTVCWNPLHLSIGTQSDNMRDCVNKGRLYNQKKTHCPYGHEYSWDNIYWSGTKRQCKICRQRRDNEAVIRRQIKNGNIQ